MGYEREKTNVEETEDGAGGAEGWVVARREPFLAAFGRVDLKRD